jgi:hypothetical protein
MLTVNKKTMLFEGFNEEERREMIALAKELVLKGNLPYPYPKYITLWVEAAGYNNDQFLMSLSAFPQRLLLSLVV